jgi:hypothetical protein
MNEGILVKRETTTKLLFEQSLIDHIAPVPEQSKKSHHHRTIAAAAADIQQ